MQQPRYSVVQVIDQLNIGGAEQVLVMLANLLHEHGQQVTVIITVAPGPLAAKLNKHINLINLERRWKWNPFTMYRLVKLLRRFDIVHIHSSYNLRYVFLASRLFALRKPLFFHEHYGDININTRVSRHQKLIYPKVIFMAVSQQLAAWAVDKVKIPPANVFVLQNTVDRQQVKQESIPVKPRKLLLVSNFRRTKNMEFALALMRQLITSSPQDWHLTIIGQQTDKNYYNKIVEHINSYNLSDYITIIHQCDNIQPELYKYHLALHTATSETGPLVLIEYIAQGLPFITYYTGQVITQLQEHLPYAVMHDFDERTWIAAIERIFLLPRKETSLQLQQLYQDYFSPEDYYNRCIAIYATGLQSLA